MQYLVPLLLVLATTGAAWITCFEQFVPAFRRRHEIDSRDCYWLLAAFYHGDKVKAPMHFSKDETKGYKLPMFMEHGSCIIGMDFVTEEHLGDDFSIAVAADIFSLVIDHCSDNADFKYGGGAPMGIAGRIRGIVMGRKPQADEQHQNFEPVLLHKHSLWSNTEFEQHIAAKHSTDQ